MPPTADSPAAVIPPAEPGVSGKWVILGILAVALAAAGGSWWFRYNSTSRVAHYLGRENAIAVRDASKVTLATFVDPIAIPINSIWSVPVEQWLAQQPQTLTDVTSARGLLHLRNALLDDRSFEWESDATIPVAVAAAKWTHALIFDDANSGHRAYLILSTGSKLIKPADRTFPLSYQPIATGIAEMLAEFESLPAINTPRPVR